MESTTAGMLMLAGAALFFVGAAIGVPRVFTEPDRDEKVRMLAEGVVWWRVSQPFYAVGALVAALGVGSLAVEGDGTSGTLLAVSSAVLVVGAIAWSWSVYRRAVSPREFAMGELPGWPWYAYIWLTFAGLLLLGVGILSGDGPDWLGWVVVAADALFVGAYVRYGDIPPFVIYLLLSVVGFAVL